MPDQLAKKGLKYMFVHSHSIVNALVMPSQKLIQPSRGFCCSKVLGKGSSNLQNEPAFFLCFKVA